MLAGMRLLHVARRGAHYAAGTGVPQRLDGLERCLGGLKQDVGSLKASAQAFGKAQYAVGTGVAVACVAWALVAKTVFTGRTHVRTGCSDGSA